MSDCQCTQCQLADIRASLQNVLTILATITTTEGTIMATVADLTAAVAEVHGVEDSAITLIEGLIARVVAAGTDQAALDAAVADLEAGKAALAAAVAAAPADPAV